MTQNTALNNHSRFTAEKTIVQYTNPETKIDERPLIIKDGTEYSINPTN